VFASVGILLIGWQIGAAAAGSGAVSAGTTTSASGSGSTNSGSGSTSSGSGATSTGSGTTTTTGSTSDGTYTGDAVRTRFGNVQVQVTISSGSLTNVTALQLTNSDGRSVQISNRAAPILQKEVLQSQSANVANVSGATYTSQAYLTSLQSALDQGGF
jgi:uncharacterized protein with FMN-binding domain